MTLSKEIEDRISNELPPEHRVQARQAFARYGTELYHREGERVLNAILDLSNGDIMELESLLDRALRDYRDILLWHDNPEESKLDTEEKRRKFREMLKQLRIKDIDIP